MSGSDSDHAAVPAPPTPRQRGRARRRLRYLRGVRELQLRDLGGFIFDLYRYGEQREALVRGKLDAIIATDKEIRSLEELLGDTDRTREIRRPGVGGTCANCGAFHATEARFCSACGMELAVAAAAAAAVHSHAREAAHEEWQDAAQPEPSSGPGLAATGPAPAAGEAGSAAPEAGPGAADGADAVQEVAGAPPAHVSDNGVEVDPVASDAGEAASDPGEAASDPGEPASDPGEAAREPGKREEKGDTGEADPADTDTGEVAAVGAQRERSGRREPFRGRGRFRR